MKARHLSSSHESVLPTVDTAAGVLHRAWKVLNKAVDRVRHEPVRERWADLINRLNAQESGERIRRPLKQPPSASRSDRHDAPYRATRGS
jgi:hypothetical protein